MVSLRLSYYIRPFLKENCLKLKGVTSTDSNQAVQPHKVDRGLTLCSVF